MAKGFEENRIRNEAIASFGKDLARRSRSRCELCEQSGLSLSAMEVPPAPREPAIGHCVFLCDDCRDQSENIRRFQAGENWRCLAQTLWSETPAVQVMAVRLLRRQSASQPWAREALENAFLDPDVESWADQSE